MHRRIQLGRGGQICSLHPEVQPLEEVRLRGAHIGSGLHAHRAGGCRRCMRLVLD